MIRVESLSKRYGKLQALKEVSLTIETGKTTAILGPNGAGKSTLMKSILGLVKLDSGVLYVQDKPILTTSTRYREAIGYMPQIPRFPENLLVREIIEMIQDIRSATVEPDWTLATIFGLQSELDKPFKTLSGGNRQKVSASMAFMFRPDLLILDEPTAGLDPIASSRLKDQIVAYRNSGKTVIITSHIMSEIQELADEVIYLINGEVAFIAPVFALMQESGLPTLERAIAWKIEQGEQAA